ncbi:MAG TPA: (4Fe-4S)-binding protein [Dehalococcoidia bacterium]|nr:(4Fe-4S)-binding protein [Dehalococcoidia bacterium]
MAEIEERKKPTVAREYFTDEIIVTWEPSFCMHSARCLMGLPQVFDADARPWIAIDAASADEIAEVVMQCPSGALHFRRLNGGRQEEAPAETTVRAVRNGPLFQRGRIRITDNEGKIIREDTRVALCRCGGSANKPFCDGTHRAIGFQAD